MPCYFLRGGRIAGVEILPLGLSDEAAVERAHTLSSKRRGPFDGFEVWDRARFVFSRPPPPRLGAHPTRNNPRRIVFMDWRACADPPKRNPVACLRQLTAWGIAVVRRRPSGDGRNAQKAPQEDTWQRVKSTRSGRPAWCTNQADPAETSDLGIK
jgi:hypothetical protein